MNPAPKMTGLQKITLQISTKGGMVIDAATASESHRKLAEENGWIMTHESTGKTWIWVQSLISNL